MSIKIKHIFVTLFLVYATSFNAQEVDVPVDLQMELIPKILSLNKSYDLTNSQTNIKIGILFSDKQRASSKVKDEMLIRASERNNKIINATLSLHSIDIDKIENLKEYLVINKIRVLYLAPLRGYNIDDITKICKDEKIITFTGVSSYLNQNEISVGFHIDNNKLQITINLESAVNEGAKFSSQLLKVTNIK